MTVDPITLEVVRNGVSAAAEEMNATLIRTAYSPNIKERRDCSCAIFDQDGAMISQAENIPVHLGAMPFSVAAAVAEYPIDTLAPGDAILLNDPFRGGAHLPDLTLVAPIFFEDELVGFAANRAHHADVGGTHAGSIVASSSEIYAEGIRIPPVRLVRDGSFVDDVVDLLLANTRDPDERRGDLRAQHAANSTGQERIGEVIERHGLETFRAVVDASNDYSERRMRAEIEELPDGEFHFRDVLEDDGRGNQDLPIDVTVTVDGASITIDFAGSAPQTAGAVNAVYAVTVSATFYAMRALTDPEIPPNEGCYRPISVTAPSGTIVNAEPPAAVVGGNLETSQRIVDAIFGAIASGEPEGVPAASQGTMNNLTFGGTNTRTGREYAFYETIAGGHGARPDADGMDGVQIHMTNTMNTPIEVLESVYPLRVTHYGLRPDSGGPGEYRGGLGIRRDIEIRDSGTTFSLFAERRARGPYGLCGGKPGTPGSDELVDTDGATGIPSKTTRALNAGDIVRIRTPGGGGYGDPADRPEAAIRQDLQLEKVTPAGIRRDYDREPPSLDEG